jgi:hypothetical protein
MHNIKFKKQPWVPYIVEVAFFHHMHVEKWLDVRE